MEIHRYFVASIAYGILILSGSTTPAQDKTKGADPMLKVERQLQYQRQLLRGQSAGHCRHETRSDPQRSQGPTFVDQRQQQPHRPPKAGRRCRCEALQEAILARDLPKESGRAKCIALPVSLLTASLLTLPGRYDLDIGVPIYGWQRLQE
jgi:hypothetical protein